MAVNLVCIATERADDILCFEAKPSKDNQVCLAVPVLVGRAKEACAVLLERPSDPNVYEEAEPSSEQERGGEESDLSVF